MTGTATPLSLNEIRFFFTRAAVGAGAPFGIGEDFAHALIWLAGLGADPAAFAAPALARLAGGESAAAATLAKRDGGLVFRSDDGVALSAIYAGPAAADLLAVEGGRSKAARLVLQAVDQPALLVAAIAAAEVDAGRIDVFWPAGAAERHGIALDHGDIAFLSGEEMRRPAPAPVDVEVTLNGAIGDIWPARRISAAQCAEGRTRTLESGVSVAEAPWATVFGFFRKCLVPSTDRSRLAGAGAGLTDND